MDHVDLLLLSIIYKTLIKSRNRLINTHFTIELSWRPASRPVEHRGQA